MKTTLAILLMLATCGWTQTPRKCPPGYYPKLMCHATNPDFCKDAQQRCVEDPKETKALHWTTEREWQELMERLKQLEYTTDYLVRVHRKQLQK
jgi:hypothetical protein